MIDPIAALVLGVDILALGLMICWPLSRSFDRSDKGTGNRVDLPPPLTPSWARVATFLLICSIVCAWTISFRKPSLTDVYQNLAALVANSVDQQPAAGGAFVSLLTSFV